MATKEQYDFFSNQYTEEEQRNIALTKKAEIYFSIISIFFGAIILKIKDIYDLISSSILYSIFFAIISLVLIIALFLIMNSLKIRGYQRPTDLNEFVNSLGYTPPSNEDFFDDRIIDFIAATTHNVQINDLRAKELARARVIVLLGTVLISLFSISTIFKNSIL